MLAGILEAHSVWASERWSVQASGGEGEYLTSRLRDADSVLELRREGPIAGHRSPAVGQDLHWRPAEIDHRLDGEEHAGLELQPFAWLPVMQDVRPVVEHAPQAMAAEIAYHAATLGLSISLDGGTDIAGSGARTHRGNPAHQGMVGDLKQPLGGPGEVSPP